MKNSMVNIPDIKVIVKDNLGRLARVTANYAYITVSIGSDLEGDIRRTQTWEFPVKLSDIGTGTIRAIDKAIYYMRWIRKAIDNQEFILINTNEYPNLTTKSNSL
jgi:hypothetical protein